jgi:hypothetical protein
LFSARKARSEAFRHDESDDEIAAKRQGDGQTDKDLDHCALLDPADEARVNGKKTKGADADGKIDQVRH